MLVVARARERGVRLLDGGGDGALHGLSDAACSDAACSGAHEDPLPFASHTAELASLSHVGAGHERHERVNSSSVAPLALLAAQLGDCLVLLDGDTIGWFDAPGACPPHAGELIDPLSASASGMSAV